MKELKSLEAKIDSMLADADQVRAQSQDHFRRRMIEIDERTNRFSKSAAVVMATVVRPRMELLARKFDNAVLIDPARSSGYASTCAFKHTDRFPASTELEFSVGADDRIENLVIAYHLEIRPIFLAFQGHDQLTFPLEAVDQATAVTWVEARIGDFLKTYLQLEVVKQYPQENMETDPVCGMPVNRNWAAAQMEYEGKTHYFCIEECQQKFSEAPERFASSTRTAGRENHAR